MKIFTVIILSLILVGCASKPVPSPTLPPNPATASRMKAIPKAGPSANTVNVQLAWDATADGRVTQYRIYQGASARSYTNVIAVAVPQTTATFSNLVRGVTYYFAGTCATTNLESAYSGEVVFTPDLLPPTMQNLRLNILSAAMIEGPWLPLTNLLVAINTNAPADFFRLEARPE